jgi:asparagine synthetase B (glutamine-hydrolysing)
MAYLIDLFHHYKWTEIFKHLGEHSVWDPHTNLDQFTKATFFRSLLRYHLPPSAITIFRNIRSQLFRETKERSWYTEYIQKLSDSNHVLMTRPNRQRSSAHFMSLYETARSNYYVICMEENNKLASLSGLEIVYPFLDRDLISFLMSIPGEIPVNGGDTKALLRASMKDILPRAIYERRGKGDSTLQANEGMEINFNHFIQDFQRDALVVQYGYVNGDYVREELEELKKQLRTLNTATLTWSFEKLFSLEMWLRMFF